MPSIFRNGSALTDSIQATIKQTFPSNMHSLKSLSAFLPNALIQAVKTAAKVKSQEDQKDVILIRLRIFKFKK